MIKWKKLNIKRIFRYIYLKLVRTNDTPPKVALGVAIGVFLGVFPTFGVGLILAYFFAWLLKVNKAAAVLGGLIMNPMTTPFFWGISALIGVTITGGSKEVILSEISSGSIFKAAGHSFLVYIIGNLIVSIIFSIISYYITLEILKRRRYNK
ncbi:MAG: DUF2062 domain-containing protein [Candidatus Firestonebacteria bacterium]